MAKSFIVHEYEPGMRKCNAKAYKGNRRISIENMPEFRTMRPYMVRTLIERHNLVYGYVVDAIRPDDCYKYYPTGKVHRANPSEVSPNSS